MRLFKFVNVFAMCCLWLAGCFGTTPFVSATLDAEEVRGELWMRDLICASEEAYMHVVSYGHTRADEGIADANEKYGTATCVVATFRYTVINASVRIFVEWGNNRSVLQKVVVSAVRTDDRTYVAVQAFERYLAIATARIEPKKWI